MKALFATLALLVGFQAQATSIQRFESHVLPTVTIDKKKVDLVAVSNVDFLEQKIVVSLYQDPCGSLTAKPGDITCRAMPVLQRELEVPLQQSKRDGCGSATFSGSVDRRPADGALTAIQVVDNTYNICEIVLPFRAQATVVEKYVSRMSRKEIKKTIKATLK